MSDRRMMYVGTEKGVVVLGEDGERWREERTTLPGKLIETLVASAETGTLYAGLSHDGVYMSTDGARSWDRVFTGDVRGVAVDPSNPATVYAGTEPVHLYRSQDSGDSWSEIEGLQRLPEKVRDEWWFPQPPHQGHVLSIFVDPRNGKRLYLAIEHGGVVHTEDGGATWEDLSEGIEYLDIHQVGVDPSAENLVYAATARGFYRSENYGKDWVLAQGGLTRDYFHDFIARPGASSTLYMTTANGSPPSWIRPTRSESAVYCSNDNGVNWRQLGGGLPPGERMMWNVTSDPLDDARLYAGGGDAPVAPQGGVKGGDVWMSLDRGDTWSRAFDSPLSWVHRGRCRLTNNWAGFVPDHRCRFAPRRCSTPSTYRPSRLHSRTRSSACISRCTGCAPA
ncbi:MAG: hypothetical protein HW416_2645 [Chloroflexi bacterium]|nr:hypothetical protein [Chloroflexota bacterium]